MQEMQALQGLQGGRAKKRTYPFHKVLLGRYVPYKETKMMIQKSRISPASEIFSVRQTTSCTKGISKDRGARSGDEGAEDERVRIH